MHHWQQRRFGHAPPFLGSGLRTTLFHRFDRPFRVPIYRLYCDFRVSQLESVGEARRRLVVSTGFSPARRLRSHCIFRLNGTSPMVPDIIYGRIIVSASRFNTVILLNRFVRDIFRESWRSFDQGFICFGYPFYCEFSIPTLADAA